MKFEEILSKLKNVTGSGDQFYAKCPAHEDNHASLSVKRRGDGGAILNCHAGCSIEQIVKAIGLTVGDLYANKQEGYQVHTAGRWNFVVDYNYQSEDGTDLFRKTRWKDATGEKHFSWSHLDTDGKWKKGRNGCPILYNLPALANTSHIYLVEGEKDVETLKKFGLAATTTPDGAGGKWYPQYTQALQGKEIVIIRDNDEPGKAYAMRAANALSGAAKSLKILDLTKEWPSLKEHGDITDAFDMQNEKSSKTKLEALELTSPKCKSTDGNRGGKNKLKLICMADVVPKQAEYLLEPYLPRGKLTIVAGVAGSTKTWLVLDWAARISRGDYFILDNGEASSTSKPGNVIYQTKENDCETDIRPRLDKLGANLSNIFMIDDHDNDQKGDSLSLLDSRLIEAAEQKHPELIIFDPIQSYLGENVDMHRANVVRPILDKMADMAKRYQCAIVLVSHLSKETTQGALDRILGSSDFRNAARSIIVVGSDPTAEDYPLTRVFVHAKNSLGCPGQSVIYHVTDYGVVYNDYSDLTEDKIVKPPETEPKTRNEKSACLEQAKNELEDILKDGKGVARREDIEGLLKMDGISQATLYRAKARLNLHSVAVGQPPHREVWWLLPEINSKLFKESRKLSSEQLMLENN